jgi:hypothetical protein
MLALAKADLLDVRRVDQREGTGRLARENMGFLHARRRVPLSPVHARSDGASPASSSTGSS